MVEAQQSPYAVTWIPAESGPYVTQRDNPAFGALVDFSGNEAIQWVGVGGRYGTNFWYHQMDLVHDCPLDDLLCGSALLGSGTASVSSGIYPVELGLLGAGRHEITATGVYLGHGKASLKLRRLATNWASSFEHQIPARLDRETIVVPLRVVIEAPRNTDSSMQEMLDPRIYMAWVDSNYTPSEQIIEGASSTEFQSAHSFFFGRSETTDRLSQWRGSTRHHYTQQQLGSRRTSSWPDSNEARRDLRSVWHSVSFGVSERLSHG